MTYELEALEALQGIDATYKPAIQAVQAMKAQALATLALNETMNNLLAFIIDPSEEKRNQLVEFIILARRAAEPSPSPAAPVARQSTGPL